MSLKAMFWHKLYFASNVRGVGGYLKLNKLCLLLCSVYLCLGITEAWRNTDVVSCTNAKHIFVNRHVTLEVVEEPITGGVCGIPASCCSSSAGRQLSGMAKKEIEDAMKTQATRLATTLQSRAKRFDEVFRALLAHSKEEFHTMFTRTYGLIYERHAHMFDELFSDLERYHSRGDLDLAKAMDRFFAVLYQKMFVELNAQYHFDDKYLSCVIEHMQELQPFGDIPRKLAVQVKRAFVATRTFTRALVAAADVAHNMANMRSQSSCASLMVKVRWCGACSGISEMACPNFCLNAARACLPLYADISADWDAFVDAMDKVADRLLGPFNIAMVVEPIDIKISEAIMNFQEHSQELSETVFTGCGKPVLGPRPPDTGYFPAGQRLTRSVDYQPYPESKRFNDNSDDFEIETSEESLLKKNPFILSRGSSRKNLLDKHERNEDFKSKMNVNTKVDDNNDLFSEDSEYSRGKNFDKRMVYERLVSGSRNKREADPDPVKNSKEIEFETYDFYSQSQRGNGGRRRGNKKKQGGGKKKNQEVVDETANARPDETSLETGGESRYGPTLDRMVREVRQKVKDTKKIWQRLPQVYCESISAPEAEEKCWNGTHVAKYLPPLAGEGTAALATNPELRGSAAGPVPAASTGVTPAVSLVSTQQFNLKAIIGKLKNAYNGLDVLWTEGEDSAFLTFGSGSSSGDDITDDDDTEESGGPPDQEEGSGHHIPEEPKFPVKEPDQDISEETDTYNPPIVSNNDPDTGIIDENEDIDPEIDERNSIDSEKEQPTGSGADPKEEMSLQRAMITYLFPIVCVWFGGIITDIA